MPRAWEEQGSWHCWQPELPLPTRDPLPPAIQRLGPLHVSGGIPDPSPGQLRSVVEAVLRSRYQDEEAGRPDTFDPRSTDGMKRALSQEPSLSWACAHASTCIKYLKERSHSSGGLTPLGKKSRSQSRPKLAERCAGKPGRLPPVGAGGAGYMAAYFMKSQSASLLSGAAAARLAGIESEISPSLSWRLRQLAVDKPGTVTWIIVEICRNCDTHKVFQHDEGAFLARYHQLKAAVERNLPGEVQVALLDPGRKEDRDPESQAPRGATAPIRPGAFEVYLCSPDPLASFGAVELPVWALPGEEPGHSGFTAICIASKLSSKTWPSAEAVVRRLVSVLPRIPLRVSVRNAGDLPVPGVEVEVVTTQTIKNKDGEAQDLADPSSEPEVRGQLRLTGVTDRNGQLRLSVPVCVPMQITAGHDVLMATQCRHSLYTQLSAVEDFLSDTILQLWQVEVGKELIILCSSPRTTPNPKLPAGAGYFRGYVELTNRERLDPDDQGCVKGHGELLQDLVLVGVPGWRASRVALQLAGDFEAQLSLEEEGLSEGDNCNLNDGSANNILSTDSVSNKRDSFSTNKESTGTNSHQYQSGGGSLVSEPLIVEEEGVLLEVARLNYPVVKVSLIAACCGCRLPNAQVTVDGNAHGHTPASGDPLQCELRCGEHQLEALHTLAPEGLRVPFCVESSANCSVQVKISPKRLRFVCVAEHSGEGGPHFADLWLVGGSVGLAKFGRRRHIEGLQTWLWDGDLSATLQVRGGALTTTGKLPKGAKACNLSQELSTLESCSGPWRVSLNAVNCADRCILRTLSKQAAALLSKDIADPQRHAPAEVWLGRLTYGEDLESTRGKKVSCRLRFNSTCCSNCLPRAKVIYEGSKQAEVEGECFGLPRSPVGTRLEVKVDGFPLSCLPGNSRNFAVIYGANSSSDVIDVPIQSLVWLYWVPPDDDCWEELETGIIYLVADQEHIPDGAQPLRGMILAPGTETEQIDLDGTSMGPFQLQAVSPESRCGFAGLQFNLKPPEHFEFEPMLPCPLQERVEELGGCELERLVACPVGVAKMQPSQAPNPRQLRLTCGCCRSTFRGREGEEDVRVTLDDQATRRLENGLYKLPRRKVTDTYEGSYSALVQHIPTCLLPEKTEIVQVPFSPSEPAIREIVVGCRLWLYWLPPSEDDESETPEGGVFVVSDEAKVPDGARTIQGVLKCPGSEQDFNLSGNFFGPIIISPKLGQAPADPTGCLLETLVFELQPPEDYEYLPLDFKLEGSPPSGECRLSSLAYAAVQVGCFRALPPPPLPLTLKTVCCQRGYPCSTVAINGKEPLEFPPDGCLELARIRKGGLLQMAFSGVPFDLLQFPDGQKTVEYTLKEPERIDLNVMTMLWLYWTPPDDEIDPDAPLESLHDEILPESGPVFLAARAEDVPADAQGVKGALLCPSAMNTALSLDGTTTGPFKVRPYRGPQPALKRASSTGLEDDESKAVSFMETKSQVGGYDDDDEEDDDLSSPPSSPSDMGARSTDQFDEDEDEEGEEEGEDEEENEGSGEGKASAEGVNNTNGLDGSYTEELEEKPSMKKKKSNNRPTCMLGSLRFRLDAPPGYSYTAKHPSPLLERLRETGGCELERVANCPVSVGFFKEAAHPKPYRLLTRTACCGRGWEGAEIHVDGQKSRPLIEPGCFRVPPRDRTKRKGHGVFQVSVGQVPSALLDQGEQFEVDFGHDLPENHVVDVSSLIWIYAIPPPGLDSEGEEDEEDEGQDAASLPSYMIYVCANKDHIPQEAEPVVGQLRCVGAERESTTLNGSTFGPFPIRRSDEEDGEIEELTCLWANIELDLAAPSGWEWEPSATSPLEERVKEFGGCELQRVAQCPQVLGFFRAKPRPPLQIQLFTPCCSRPFCGAGVQINKKPLMTFGAEGCVSVARRVNGGSVKVKLHEVPPYLLPEGKSELVEHYGPFDPLSIELPMTCEIYVYYLPVDEEEAGEDVDEDDLLLDLPISIALNPADIPEGAMPVSGKIKAPGAISSQILLDNSSMGPFDIRPAEMPEEDEEGNIACLLGSLTFDLQPPDDFVYRAKDPTPLKERVEQLGGCELQRLMECPVVVGFFSPIPIPPLKLALRTCCCGRAFAGSRALVDGAEAQDFDDSGALELKRRRAGGEISVKFDGVPSYLLPDDSEIQVLAYGPQEPDELLVETECSIWVYYVPPPVEEENEDSPASGEEAEEEEEEAEGTVFVCLDKEQIPSEALEVSGQIVDASGRCANFELDGRSMGPFEMKRLATSPSHKAPEGSEVECLLASLRFRMKDIEGYTYQARSPSPLKLRTEEFGGCELQRLLACPQAVGAYRPIPLPPLHLSITSACCGVCAFPNTSVEAKSNFTKKLDGSDGAGPWKVKQKRGGGRLKLAFEGLPEYMIPGGIQEFALKYENQKPDDLNIEVLCPFWLYYEPPDEEEEEDEEDEDAAPPPLMVSIVCNPEQVPEEALPLAGTLRCPGAANELLELPGNSVGPFYFRRDPAKDASSSMCLLAYVDFTQLEPPEGYTYRPKEISPLLQRCEDIGECELERLMACGAAVGFLDKEL